MGINMITKFDKYKESIRDKMTPKSEEDIIKSLKNSQPNYKLLKGSENGLILVVKQALEEGADIHCWNDGPLYWAVFNSDIEMAKFLLLNGADVHAKSLEHFDAIEIAKDNYDTEMYELLKQFE